MQQFPSPPRRAFGSRLARALLLALLPITLNAAPPATPPESPPAPDLIGARRYLFSHADDTLLDLARRFDAGYIEMRLANRDIDPWLPGNGAVIRVPSEHIVPAVSNSGIVINLAELRLYWLAPGQPPLSFPIGIGEEGAETPTGSTRIVRRAEHPTWIPTASERAEKPDLPAVVPPGPDNPMGDYALYLGWPGYAIHGTDKPLSVGRRGSHGCIRMYPEDIERLYPLVKPGAAVTVIDLRFKTGWRDGQLYLEVHPSQQDLDAAENGRFAPALRAPDLTDTVLEAAGSEVDRIDWPAVRNAAELQDGMPVQITRAAILPP